MRIADSTGPVDPRTPDRSRLYNALAGATTLVIFLQGLWAGIFLEHDGERDNAAGWIDVHARGGEVAIVLAAASAVVAFIRTRSRKDLWMGSGVLAAILILESYLGGLIRDDSKDTLTAIHVPVAMALMGLSVWLPLRGITRHEHSRSSTPQPSEPATTNDAAISQIADHTDLLALNTTIIAAAHTGDNVSSDAAAGDRTADSRPNAQTGSDKQPPRHLRD